jgi:hypothetical protein
MVCLSGTPASRGLLTTTYATTYGWVSAGIRRELIAPPQSKKRLDGTKRDQTGLNLCTERLATNQKAAGSSPAERATKSPVLQVF